MHTQGKTFQVGQSLKYGKHHSQVIRVFQLFNDAVLAKVMSAESALFPERMKKLPLVIARRYHGLPAKHPTSHFPPSAAHSTDSGQFLDSQEFEDRPQSVVVEQWRIDQHRARMCMRCICKQAELNEIS